MSSQAETAKEQSHRSRAQEIPIGLPGSGWPELERSRLIRAYLIKFDKDKL
jgi:hypothetical protein